MSARAAGAVYTADGAHGTRRARSRSSLLLFAVLLLGAGVATFLAVELLVRGQRLGLEGGERLGACVLAGGVALLLLCAALWQRFLLGAAHRDQFVLQRTVEALRRREAYEESQAELMARISDLIEVFTRTRNLEAVLNEAVRSLQSTLGVSLLVLQLYAEEAGKFTLSIEQGGEGIDLGEEVRRDVIEEGKSRLVNSLPSSGSFQNLVDRGYTSLMVAPLGRGRRATDRSIGLVAALSKDDRDFTGHELSLLAHFARHAGLIIENAQLYKRAEHLALHDGLTNLYNHRHFVDTLNAEIEKARHIDAPVSLIMADIDNFKRYNDTHGHPQGDVLLRQIAQVLLENTRQRDIVARYGGEEFVIILPITGRYGARRVAETIRAQVEQFAFQGEEDSGPITITVGVAVFPEDASTAEALIQKADDALYRGKEEGKNRVCWSSLPAAPAPEESATSPG
ncbi:MAG: diguanylate cyclase [Candidatus Brocadiia bacterium]